MATVSQKMLTQTLRELERDRLVTGQVGIRPTRRPSPGSDDPTDITRECRGNVNQIAGAADF
nr:winged helix-turn-helix transcriptional regulator [Catenulispora pinisilvae]